MGNKQTHQSTLKDRRMIELLILQGFDEKLAEWAFFQDLVLHDGAAAVLSVLHSDDIGVQLPLLRTLERLVSNSDCAKEVRQLGGTNVLLALLSAPATPSSVVSAICSRWSLSSLLGPRAPLGPSPCTERRFGKFSGLSRNLE